MIEGHKAPCAEGMAAGWTEPAPCPEDAKPWILAATILGSSLAFIVGSVVNVALPAIQSGLDATAAEMQWVINAYLLILGSLILVGGSAGDRFGRRRIFLAGTAVFAGASIWCGLAPGASSLIAGRAVQGVGGALLVPTSLTVISATFGEGERAKAIGTWAGASALTTAFAPVLGGWLVDIASWRWVFFVVVPFALVTIGIAARHLPETREAAAGPLDWRGGILVTAGIGAITYGLIASSGRGWGAGFVLGPVLLGALLLGLFLRTEARAPAPMMPLELFRSRSFSGANLMTLLLYFALGAAFFFLPFNLIQVQGYSATAAGAAFLPFTLVIGFLSPLAGGFSERVGARIPLMTGPSIAGLGLVLLTVPRVGGSYWTTFFPGILVLGVGMTVSVAPLTNVVMSAVEPVRVGVASGINNATSRIAGLLAVALLGAVALGIFGRELDLRLAHVDAPSQAKQVVADTRLSLAAATIPTDVSPATQDALREAVHLAFVGSFRWVMGIAAAFAFTSALVAALAIEPPPGGRPRHEGG
jgi:EmrB/QacA subfamily drug resistance transporter